MRLISQRTTRTLLLTSIVLVTACDKAWTEPSGNSSAQSAEQSTSTGPISILSVELLGRANPHGEGGPTKLEEWKDIDNSKRSGFPVFDVVATVQNMSNESVQSGDYIVLTTIDFVIAPTYLHGGDVKRIMQTVPWSRLVSVDDVQMGILPFLKPRDRAEVKISNFDLSGLTERYNGRDDTLWPWALRVNVHVLDRDLKRIALGQKILKIIPSDNRLKAK